MTPSFDTQTPHLPTTGCPYLAHIVPSDEDERQAQAMETWLQACASDEPFALELFGTNRDQGFVLRASSQAQLVMLCKQLEAQYPQAEISRLAPGDDPLLLHVGEQAVVGTFALAQPSWMALKTFSGKTLIDPGADPLAAILAAMESAPDGCRVISQLALVRAPETWMGADLRKAVEHPLQPERDQAMASAKSKGTASDNAQGIRLLVGILLALFGLLAYRGYHQHKWVDLAVLAIFVLGAVIFLLWRLLHAQRAPALYDMKQVSEKLSRQGFYTQLRVIVIGSANKTDEASLRQLLRNLEVAYRQFSQASANSLYLKRMRVLSILHPQASHLVDPRAAFPYRHPVRRFLHGGAFGPDVWNSLEIAGAYHLPQAGTDLPLVRRISVKQLLFPPQVADEILQAPAPLPPAHIGASGQRSHRIAVRLPFSTLFGHKLLIGRSRYGKSVLMQLLLQALFQRTQDSSPQPGVFVIDPHHDLVQDILGLIPHAFLSRVLLLDLTDSAYPIAINPLDASMGFTRDQAVSNFMSSSERIWKESWGPRMSYFLRNVCMLLFTLNERLVREGRADEQFTLLDINPLLQYQDYAYQVLSMLDMSETWHQELMAWWINTYFTLPKNSSFRQEVILPILSKMGAFNDNQLLRRIVGQPVTKAPIHQAVTEGKIVLCALASRDLDDAAVNILGSTLINLLHRAFASQHDVPLTQRRKVFVAVDEFQAFAGADYDKLLSEDAKYGCAMTMATQNLKRLNAIRDGLLEMALSNCENLFVFNVSAVDAKILEAELQERVTQKHIISQPRLHCYARLALTGYPITIASVQLARPRSWERASTDAHVVSALRRELRQVLALRPVQEIDQLHAAHLERFLDIGPYAQKIQREARSVRTSLQRRKEALEQEASLRAQMTTGSMHAVTTQSTQPQTPAPTPASTPDMPAATPTSITTPTPIPTQATPPPSAQADTHAEQGKAQSAQVGQAHKKTGHRRRKRRTGTTPPSPDQPTDPQQVDAESALEQHVLSFPVGDIRGRETERERERA